MTKQKNFNSPYFIGNADYLLSLKKNTFLKVFKKMEGYKSDEFKKNLKILNNQELSIIDIGCGLGSLIPFYTSLNLKNCRLVDINLKFLKICKLFVKNSYKKKTNFRFNKGSIFEIKKYKKYDLVVCNGVINYFDKNRQKKLLNNLVSISNKYMLIEIIGKKTLFHKIFNLTSNLLVKKIISIFNYILSYIFRCFFFLKRDNNFIIFLVRVKNLLSDLSSTNQDASFIYDRSFYETFLKNKKFMLVKTFSYRSLRVLFFSKNK